MTTRLGEYKISVCGEYVYLNQYTQSASDLNHAIAVADGYLSTEDKSSISIHAFDKFGNFSHVEEW